VQAKSVGEANDPKVFVHIFDSSEDEGSVSI